jgi:hypothetical protein|tara:strand:- start:11937 stop:12668 length:732 start_codon:yes stop_codon:yes gene_type:complete
MAGITDLYKAIPTNMRIFAENLVGKRAPVTEKDFTPRELGYMRRQVSERSDWNDIDEAKARRALKAWQDGKAQAMRNNARWHKEWPTRIKDPAEYEAEYDENVERARKKVASYEKTRGRTSIDYRDYGKDVRLGEHHYVPQRGTLETIRDSFSKPGYVVQTTLGQYVATKLPDGTVEIKDTYDWEWEGEKLSVKEFLSNLPAMLKSPRAAGNVMMRQFGLDKKRDVNITLPKEYSRGGRVRIY